MAEAGNGPLRLRTDDLTWREVGDELVVLKLSTGTYLTLNTVGKELWLELDGGATAEQLVTGLVDRYGITGEQATEDVTAFVADLRSRELLAD
ncbi:MAG: PqqD family protein [Acidimicrobiales bacterium]